MFSVIFEVHPAEGKRDAYLHLAAELKPVIETIDGFIDNERFESRARSGWVLSLSTWRDEKSVIRWRTQVKHHFIQEKGRSDVFSDYHLRVGEISADTNPPVALCEHRFDTTEVGRSKFCTITEIVPSEDRALAKGEKDVLRAIGLDRSSSGLNEVEIYDSIYNPGKVLVLCSWANAASAERFHPGVVSRVQSIRHRVVRVIRDYGMYDRRETPQYYADIQQKR
jgi:heme-degrading monooxygenase HmoA